MGEVKLERKTGAKSYLYFMHCRYKNKILSSGSSYSIGKPAITLSLSWSLLYSASSWHRISIEKVFVEWIATWYLCLDGWLAKWMEGCIDGWKVGWCLHPFRLLELNTTDLVANKQQKWISYSSGCWKYKINVPVWSDEDPLPGCKLLVVYSHGRKGQGNFLGSLL